MFAFYDIVKVVSCSDARALGLEGPVVGMAEDDDGGWTYGVQLDELEEVWSFAQEDLRATGRALRREDIYPGESIRVVVDPKTGEACTPDARKNQKSGNDGPID